MLKNVASIVKAEARTTGTRTLYFFSTVSKTKCYCGHKENISVASTGTSSESGIDIRDHLLRTRNMERHNSVVPTTVMEIKNLSSTVKRIKLAVETRHRAAAAFKAGQWVDMMIPDVETIGGFSICNSPHSLQEHGYLELAVKFSDHPPAFWIHTECKVGAHVDIRVGGNFFYNDMSNKNTLLLAGGVGINPLLSILRHRQDLHAENKSDCKTTLLYSAKTAEQLIFQDEIRQICCSSPFKCQFHLTKDKKAAINFKKSSNVTLCDDKISEASIHEFSKPYRPDSMDCYICGPPGFIDKMKEFLLNIDCSEKSIYFEKWW